VNTFLTFYLRTLSHSDKGSLCFSTQVQQVQNSMQSKGGYEESAATEKAEGLDVNSTSGNNVNTIKSSSSPNEITITLNSDGS